MCKPYQRGPVAAQYIPMAAIIPKTVAFTGIDTLEVTVAGLEFIALIGFNCLVEKISPIVPNNSLFTFSPMPYILQVKLYVFRNYISMKLEARKHCQQLFILGKNWKIN